MKTKELKKEVDKKRAEVIAEMKKRKNKEVTELTGFSPGYISNIKSGINKLSNYEKLFHIAERLRI